MKYSPLLHSVPSTDSKPNCIATAQPATVLAQSLTCTQHLVFHNRARAVTRAYTSVTKEHADYARITTDDMLWSKCLRVWKITLSFIHTISSYCTIASCELVATAQRRRRRRRPLTASRVAHRISHPRPRALSYRMNPVSICERLTGRNTSAADVTWFIVLRTQNSPRWHVRNYDIDSSILK